MMHELHRSAPNAARAQAHISFWAFKNKRFELARAAAEQAVAADPNSAVAHYTLATVLMQIDRPRALRSAREARRLSPKSSIGHASVAFCALAGAPADPGEGLRAAREWARLTPEIAEAFFVLGQLARREGELDEARAAYKRAAELKPTEYGKYAATIVRALAPPPRLSPRTAEREPFLAAMRKGDALSETNPKSAAEAFREAVRLDPTDPDARARFAIVLALAGNFAEALPEARAAVRLDPGRARSHYALVVVYMGKSQYRAAIASAREAVRLDPENAGFHYWLGLALLRVDDTVGARIAYQQAALFDSKKYGKLIETLPALAVAPIPRLGLDRSDPVSLVARGTELRTAGNTAGAADLYRDALKLEPTNSRTHNLLGLCSHAEKDYAAAEVHYRNAIRHDPVYAIAHSNLSVALRLQGQTAEAEAAAKVALRLNPRYAHGHMALGLALRARGDETVAVRVLAEAARLDPKQYGQYAPKPRAKP
jgi:tetratricopeptide (TPR) repeat protein